MNYRIDLQMFLIAVEACHEVWCVCLTVFIYLLFKNYTNKTCIKTIAFKIIDVCSTHQ